MTSEMIFAVLVALLLLVPAAYAAYRAAHTPPRPAFEGECTGEDCRQCAIWMVHPSQAPTRQQVARVIKPQTRKGW
ncbi:hypothetical protein ACIP2X_18640 [Streptomyces sp. NPDC089424]|uniref:hypothetical protein n=1 Tax=Streptomyces sp. NPDC089424 TaxID=3365917 RepID=UPI00380FA696